MLGHQLEKDFDDMFSRFDSISDRDRPTGQHRAANKKAMLSQGNLAMPRVSIPHPYSTWNFWIIP